MGAAHEENEEATGALVVYDGIAAEIVHKDVYCACPLSV